MTATIASPPTPLLMAELCEIVRSVAMQPVAWTSPLGFDPVQTEPVISPATIGVA